MESRPPEDVNGKAEGRDVETCPGAKHEYHKTPKKRRKRRCPGSCRDSGGFGMGDGEGGWGGHLLTNLRRDGR